jgi:acyl-ACP thioesterase
MTELMTAKEKLLFVGSFFILMNWGTRLTSVVLESFIR